MPYTGIILAGGRSSRMGSDKSLIEFQNEKLIERIVKEVQTAADEIIIVSNQQDKYQIDGTREVSDIYSGMGPLGGIHAGLTAAENYYCFVTACDMPFLKGELVTYLLSQCEGFDVTVPRINGCLEPLCAVYSQKYIEYAEDHLKNDLRTVYDFHPQAQIKYVDKKHIEDINDSSRVFFNLNTPTDMERLMKMRKEI